MLWNSSPTELCVFIAACQHLQSLLSHGNRPLDPVVITVESGYEMNFLVWAPAVHLELFFQSPDAKIWSLKSVRKTYVPNQCLKAVSSAIKVGPRSLSSKSMHQLLLIRTPVIYLMLERTIFHGTIFFGCKELSLIFDSQVKAWWCNTLRESRP